MTCLLEENESRQWLKRMEMWGSWRRDRRESGGGGRGPINFGGCCGCCDSLRTSTFCSNFWPLIPERLRQARYVLFVFVFFLFYVKKFCSAHHIIWTHNTTNVGNIREYYVEHSQNIVMNLTKVEGHIPARISNVPSWDAEIIFL